VHDVAIENPPPKTAPFGVLWSVTQRCNLNCKYCHASGSSTDFFELPYEDLKKIADILHRVNCRNIVINGGEPLTRDNIFNLIDYVRRDDIRVAINTNGTLVDEKAAKFFGDRELVVGVSIDGPNEFINSITRGSGTLKKAVNAVKLLVKHGAIVNILVDVTRFNFDYILGICRLADKLGVEIVCLQDFHPIGRGEGRYGDFTLTPRQEKSILRTMTQIAKRFPDLKINQEGFAYWATLGHPDDGREKKMEPNLICEGKSCQRGMYIDAHGHMYMCPSLWMIPLGNVLEDDIMDAWENSEGSKIFRDLGEIPVTKIPGCADCEHNRQCCGGCRGDAFMLYGDWLAAHPRCPYGPNFPYKKK